VRGRGLWAGLEFASLSGREVCERLAARGVLAKETHGSFTPSNLHHGRSEGQELGTIRLAPPLIIGEADLEWGIDQIAALCSELA
jgi:ornithine--oxo-acid transaminase